MKLLSLELLPERVTDTTQYPFNVPAIQSLTQLKFPSRVTCFAGENGTGKSTLLEAIAAHIGFGREGGNRNFMFETSASSHSAEPLSRALRLGFDKRSGEGFYFRAESLFNVATYVDEIGATDAYGGKSLHDHSHGETFWTVLDHKFRRSGLFLLDEPEAALSPQRQLAFMVLIHDTLRDYKDAQFILCTHSPILLGYPGATIYSFDEGRIQQVDYEQTQSYKITHRFLNDRPRFTTELLQDPDLLFPE